MKQTSLSLREISDIINSNFSKKLYGAKKQKIHFNALNLTVNVEDNILFIDAGYAKNLPEFSLELDKLMEINHPKKLRIPKQFTRKEEELIGGNFKPYYFKLEKNNDKNKEYRLVGVIYYKSPKKDLLEDIYIRGHEETHALCFFGAFDDFKLAVNEQFNLDLGSIKKPDLEVIGHIGGVRAAQIIGYSLEDIIINKEKKGLTSFKEYQEALKLIKGESNY